MLGIDIGTTSTKAVLYDLTGHVIFQENIGYPLYTPNISTAEQNPEQIFDAIITAISNITVRVDASKISFISFSSAMHSIIAIDEANQPITPCIIWADNRSESWAQKIKNEYNGHEIYLKTGTPIHPMSPLSKITWLVNDHPEIASKTKKYIGIKEFIFKKLFDQYVVDYSLASSMGLMNLNNLEWDCDALQVAGISSKQLSTLVPTTTIYQNCNSLYAKKMGISTTTPFIIGASDGVLSNLGVNAIKSGEVAVTIGTSGAIRTIINKPKTDEKERIFCYALTETHWVIGGAVNNGGIIFKWIHDEFAASEIETAKRLGIDSFEILTKIIENVQPGSDGLIFHPYLSGERAPLWNPDARGSFFGLTLAHKKEHMIRAALEGVIYNLYTVYLALLDCMDEDITCIQATGGFARSKVWRQMMADIFNINVIVPESFESSCLGACMLGLYATKQIKSFDEVTYFVGQTFEHTPDKEATKNYRDLLPIFINLSKILDQDFTKISNYQRNNIEKH